MDNSYSTDHDLLIKIDQKLSDFIETSGPAHLLLIKLIDGHEVRLRSIEKFQWGTVAIAGFLAGLISLLVRYLPVTLFSGGSKP